MIFVTVGTHEQQFNRLVKGIDELKGKGVIRDEVVIQTGYSDYVPAHCQWKQWVPYKDMQRYVEEADIVITHGGPSSFIMPLKAGKVPVVVPRRYEYDEHVNDHQVDFLHSINRDGAMVIAVEDMADMEKVLTDYKEYASQCKCGREGNNKRFNQLLGDMVEELMQGAGSGKSHAGKRRCRRNTEQGVVK